MNEYKTGDNILRIRYAKERLLLLAMAYISKNIAADKEILQKGI